MDVEENRYCVLGCEDRDENEIEWCKVNSNLDRAGRVMW